MTTKWVTSNPPKAGLIPVDTVPVVIVNGVTMQRFITRFGAWWAQVVYPGGFYHWLRLIEVD